ncbi:MAG TPA: hypothetical protein VHM30_09855 [Gemmatimonadaceae bacterium]|nr:hypothetical protein [Gemmatimonadaceae bacterium]
MLADVLVPFFAFATLIVAIKTVSRVYLERTRLKHGGTNAPLDSQRIERIEQIVETMAIEIERISEGQRFTTRLLAERQEGELPVPRQREAGRVITPH